MVALTVAPTIDLSSLPAPTVIEALDYEARLAARMASLTARFTAAGIEYDVGALEFDPALLLQEEDCYRELQDRARINDAVRAVLPAFARGADLDAIALRAGVTRLTLTPATADTPAVMESNEHLLQRYLAAFGRPAAGSIDGYVYAAVTARPELHDVAVLGPETHGLPGRVKVVLLAANGAAVTPEQIEAVAAACNGKSVRPLTDQVIVQAAEFVDYAVTATLQVPIGPDPNIVKQAALASFNTYAALRYRVGAASPDHSGIPANAIAGALYVPNVMRVVLTAPLADIAVAPHQAPRLVGLNVTTQVVG